MDLNTELFYLHLLNTFSKFGPKRLQLLLNSLGTASRAFRASESELLKAGFEQKLISEFFAHKLTINEEAEREQLHKLEISLLGTQSINYPLLLKEIPLPPPLLYCKGTLPEANAVYLAVVGTRKTTQYGRLVVERLLPPLVNSGLVVVSGLAFGIDEISHKVSVTHNMPTVAVLGSGLDDSSFYPKDHALLAKQIIDAGGALLSEYPPGTPAFKQNFVARNRIISGMSLGTLIVECSQNSGSLITAHHALDQNRPLYAVPGPIYSESSSGPNNLLKQGAIPVTCAEDILADLNITTESKATLPLPTNEKESKILKCLMGPPKTIDEIIVETALTSSEVSTTLVFLELRGHIKSIGSGQYTKTR